MARIRRTLAPLLAGLLLTSPRARADDAPARTRLDLSPFGASAVASGPRIRVPGDAGFAWPSLPSADEEEGALFEFQPPPFPEYGMSPELFDDQLRRLIPDGSSPGATWKATGRLLEVWGPADGVERTKKAVAFLEAAYTPRLLVTATLARTGGEPAGIASGQASLLPRRWTRVWWRRELHRVVAGYAVEIAQGSVVNRPQVAGVPEGGELYLRWSPGESASLLEVYAAEFTPLPSEKVDLSGIRNAPEPGAMGTVELPRTAVARIATTIVVAHKATSVRIPWGGPAGSHVLTLSTPDAPAAPAAVDVGSRKLRVARVAAAAAALEQGARESGVADLVGRFQSMAGADGGVKGLETTADTFLTGEAAPAELDRLRDEIVRAEAALEPLGVSLLAVRVPADGPKGDGPGGAFVVGQTLSAANDAALTGDKVAPAGSIDLPVLSGIAARARLAASVAGFERMSSAVAQNAGGVQPETGAWFDGFALEARATSGADGGAQLAVSGTIAWVRTARHTVELAFRTPIGLDGRTGTGGVDQPETRKVTLPITSNGEARVDPSVTIGAADVKSGAAVVLATVAMRDDAGRPVTLLLLGRVRR